MSDLPQEKKKPDLTSTQRWLVYVLTLGQMCLVYIVFFIHLPDSNKEIAYILIGGYSAKWGDAVAYWYNSTAGSARKNEIIAKAEPVKE